MLPQRRKRESMGVKTPEREFPGHRAFVRSFGCSVPGCDRLPIEFAHVRKGLPAGEAGGTAMKPHDKWGISLCGGPAGHHNEQHTLGETTFAAKYGLDLVALAQEFQRRSPHRHRWMEATE